MEKSNSDTVCDTNSDTLKYRSTRRMRYITALMKRHKKNFQLTDGLWKFNLLKIPENAQESTCAGVSYLMKLLVVDLEFCSQRETATGHFLRILRTF